MLGRCFRKIVRGHFLIEVCCRSLFQGSYEIVGVFFTEYHGWLGHQNIFQETINTGQNVVARFQNRANEGRFLVGWFQSMSVPNEFNAKKLASASFIAVQWD